MLARALSMIVRVVLRRVVGRHARPGLVHDSARGA